MRIRLPTPVLQSGAGPCRADNGLSRAAAETEVATRSAADGSVCQRAVIADGWPSGGHDWLPPAIVSSVSRCRTRKPTGRDGTVRRSKHAVIRRGRPRGSRPPEPAFRGTGLRNGLCARRGRCRHLTEFPCWSIWRPAVVSGCSDEILTGCTDGTPVGFQCISLARDVCGYLMGLQ